MPTEAEIAWAAGLFEGEGFMGAYERNYGSKIQAVIGLAMTDRDVVERFQSIVECGAISVTRSRTDRHKPVHSWRVYEIEKVRRVIALFLPYFCERRREQAVAVLDQSKDVQPHNRVKTHCPKGHALEGDNLVREPIRDGRYFARRCKTCRKEQALLRAMRAKEVA